MQFNLKEKVFLTKWMIYNRRTLQIYRSLLANESIGRSELDAINWSKRKKLIDYAYSSVPFYKRSFEKAGISAADIVNPEDFHNVPILTRTEIQQNFDSLRAPNCGWRHTRVSSTGGSSGQPLTVLHDLHFPYEALGWRMLKWWGCNLGEDGGYVWRFTRSNRLVRSLVDLVWWPTRRTRLDATQMSQNNIASFIWQFNRAKPVLLQGYVAALDELARYIDDSGTYIHSPKVIWVTASVMLKSQRERIQRVFGAQVFDQYGCGEVFWIAAECSAHSGLHVFSDARHVEVINSDGSQCASGEVGRILITDLENYAFPIIRYENGDLGSFQAGNCACGRHFPLMSHICGRVTDNLYLPDGTIISGDYLTTIFDTFPAAVKSFRVHQYHDFSIDLFVNPNTNCPNYELTLSKVLCDLNKKVGQLVPVRLRICEDLVSDRGKNKFVVSEVNRVGLETGSILL